MVRDGSSHCILLHKVLSGLASDGGRETQSRLGRLGIPLGRGLGVPSPGLVQIGRHTHSILQEPGIVALRGRPASLGGFPIQAAGFDPVLGHSPAELETLRKIPNRDGMC